MLWNMQYPSLNLVRDIILKENYMWYRHAEKDEFITITELNVTY